VSKFNLTQILNAGKKEDGGLIRSNEQEYKVTYIPISSLEPSEDNFYDTSQIEELKASIAAFGIKQNLVVTPTETGTYRVIAGHRRRLACIALFEEGKAEFEKAPCIVETEVDEAREKLLLIMTNSTTRQLSDWEKVKQAQELKALLEQIKKQEKIPGRLRDLIASTLDVSPAHVGRMEAISKNLAPEFKEELRAGRVNMSTAYELSGLSEYQQQEAFTEYQEKGSISIKDAKEIKQEIKVEEKTPGREEIDAVEDAGKSREGETAELKEETKKTGEPIPTVNSSETNQKLKALRIRLSEIAEALLELESTAKNLRTEESKLQDEISKLEEEK